MFDLVENDENSHEEVLCDMFLEYGKWLDEQVFKHHGFHLFRYGDVKSRISSLIPRFTSYDPSEAILLLLTVDGNVAGMTRLDKFDDGIGMIHNVFIYPEYRGRGLSKQMMYVVEEKAREFGYRFIRLDTGGFNVAAQSLYRKLGYYEIERFTDFENLKRERTRPYYLEKVYMEKQL